MGRPESLEIGRNIGRARRGDQQIASELEVELFEIAALTTLIGVGLEEGVGISGKAGCPRIAREAELHTVVDGLVVCQMALIELIVAEVLSVP